MKLKSYIRKRKLKDSPEPKAKIFKHKEGDLAFVIQKHAASHLHYDFRLEADGVLKSWAVPKGPSLDPGVKRLAMMVEDHPYDYRNFEGIIPSGYGAGTVMIWDQGTYQVEGESSKQSEERILEGLKKGAIHFTLKGEKLRGNFSLIRLKKEGNEWLLIKSRDDFASKVNILLQDRSVISHQTLEEIGGNFSKKPEKKQRKPQLIKPMLTTLIDKPFDHADWIFEIKLDGFRAVAEIGSQKVALYSRNFQSFNSRFPQIIEALAELEIDAILDGEIVALDKKGISHFQMLQNAREENLFFYVFDILYLNGRDLRSLPLLERKTILKAVLKNNPLVRYLDHIEKEGKKFFQICQKKGLEGIVGKNKESLYETGRRSRKWVKIKSEMQQEVVICGFTEPKRSRKNFGALIIGVYKKGELHFAGHVGGGFTESRLEEVKTLLSKSITKESPFQNPPKTNTPVTWVKPKYLCEVKFKEWTDAGIMRMPIFVGMRSDKPPRSVVEEKKEQAAKIPKILGKSKGLEKFDFLTHLDKIYWEEEQISKGELLLYYISIAGYILPYLKDRPESLRRFPNGISEPSFFQKNIENCPAWVETIHIRHNNRTVNYMIIQNLKSLLYAVNLGCIEIHPWFSSIKSLENPDFMIFDLDPVEIEFDAVIETALALHALLEKFGLPHFCKTSGSRGLHIGIPLKAKYSYEQAKQFAELIALMLHQHLPDITSLKRSPSQRKRKVYIDCYQNNFAQTLAAPYSVRAKPGAPVSTPLEWSEVKKGLDPRDFTIFNTLKRLKKKGDLFKPILSKGINLAKALKTLKTLG